MKGSHGRDSAHWFARAQKVAPGGVHSPVRSFAHVGCPPVFFESAKGAYLTDVAGRHYLDYVGSWGVSVLGHAPDPVVQAIQERATHALSFGACHPWEVLLAEAISQRCPHVPQMRFVSSGTEATMTAVRLARGATGRDLILKFQGAYHGHHDSLLLEAGSGLSESGQPNSLGVTAHAAHDTRNLPFNDLTVVQQAFERWGPSIAGVIVEPVSANMNVVLPDPGFLEALRALCDAHGALLIFDEVITGFRVGPSGAQGLLGVTPDLTTYGKIIGGGLPVGAVGGRTELMAHLAPCGGVYQAGTLSGNPLAMTAGLVTLEHLDGAAYHRLGQITHQLGSGFRSIAERLGVPLWVPEVCGLLGLMFTERSPVRTYEEVQACDHEAYRCLFRLLLQEGIYMAPSPYEAFFVSLAHSDADCDRTLSVFERVLPLAALKQT